MAFDTDSDGGTGSRSNMTSIIRETTPPNNRDNQNIKKIIIKGNGKDG